MCIKMKAKISIPEDVNFSVEGNTIKVESGGAILKRKFPNQILSIKKLNSDVEISARVESARARALVGTFKAHIRNMLQGVKEKFVYKLKICSIHFPMNVSVSGQELTISNFLGRKKLKKVKLPVGVEVNVEGDVIIVKAHDKEVAGETASRIERATKLTKKDRRIFQDGIFIIEKAGKVIR